MKITHHFAGGAYAKETYIARGEVLGQHSHPHDHLAILAKGVARVTTGDAAWHYEAPAVLTLEAHKAHTVEAINDVVWVCLWATDDTDPETVDTSIMEA